MTPPAPSSAPAPPPGGAAAPPGEAAARDDRRARPDVFSRAALRLVALFSAIVVLLIVVSGVILYVSVSSDFGHALTNGPREGETEQELLTRSIDRLRLQLIVIDGAIIVAIGAAGLWYAFRTLRPIRENVQAQRRFLADASHELRTPLAIMKADFEVALEDDEVGKAARPVLVSGLEEVDHMSAIVDDLLTLSRIDAHQEELVFVELDLGALAAGAVAKLQAMAANGGVRLTMTPPPDPVKVRGDAAHLERALRNVVRNAIEASPPDSEVAVSVTRAGALAAVAVADHGHGIPPEDLAHVFERFYRADAARTRDRAGSGLGLAIVDWTVRRHGGEAHIVSVVGEGTTVTIRLPAARA